MVTFRLYERDEHGILEDLKFEFELPELGVVPVVGDLILDQGVPVGMSRYDPESRTLYEVKERYFLPGQGTSSDIVWVVLVVETREGREGEMGLFA